MCPFLKDCNTEQVPLRQVLGLGCLRPAKMGKKDALLEEALLMITALASLLASSSQPKTENLKLLQRWRLACSRHIWILSHIYALFWNKKIALSLWQTLSVLLSAGWGCRPGCPALVTALDKEQYVTKASLRGLSPETWALQCRETRMNGMLSADPLPTSSSGMAPWSSLGSCFSRACSSDVPLIWWLL